LCWERGGAVSPTKVLDHEQAPEERSIDGLHTSRLRQGRDCAVGTSARSSIWTTLATNALIERRGAKNAP